MGEKSFTVEVVAVEGTDDLAIELPDNLMNLMGWKAGDTIYWHDNEDETWTISVVHP